MADPTLVTNPELANSVAALNASMGKIVEFLSHATSALVATQSIQFAKTSPLVSFFSERTSARTQAFVNGITAFLLSVGITIGFTQVPVTDAAGHLRYVIDITGLTSVSIWTHLGHFLEQWGLQQGAYVGLIKSRAVSGPTAPTHAPPVPVIVAPEGGV